MYTKLKPQNAKLIRILPTLLLLAALATSCQKTVSDFDIIAIAENTDVGDASKTRLVNESIVYWEDNDAISFCRIGETDNKLKNIKATFKKNLGELSTDANGNIVSTTVQAIFEIDPSTDAKVSMNDQFIALFPYNEDNSLQENKVQIVLDEEQGYRDDNSFASNACPMVAYGGFKDETDHAVRMLFHNLCGLVRIQILNSAVGYENVYLDKITLTAGNTQYLSGTFDVLDYSQNAPKLSPSSGKKSITITPDLEKDRVAIKKEGGLVFYVTLPALDGARTTTYSGLTITIDANNGSGTKLQMKRSIASIPIRRNGITYMPALTVSSWAVGEGNGTNTTGITGDGTALRPFLIYSAADLAQLREASNSSKPLNGISLSNTNVYFKVMCPIELNSTNWNGPINDFQCTMTYAGNQASGTSGITNSSQYPIFSTISGVVTNINVHGTFSTAANDDDTVKFSPLCHTLAAGGYIRYCVVSDDASFRYTTGPQKAIAGLCVYNNGTIYGCGCRGKFGATKFAGICYQNNSGGKILNCYGVSPMQSNPANQNQQLSAAGICFNNYGLVQDCYMAANIYKNNTRWGGIVYNNYSKVQHCYLDASGIIQSTTGVGGVVYSNEADTAWIDYCWSDADLIDVTAGGAGGIVHTMQGGEVRNCYRGRGMGGITCRGGATGGVVAYMQGGRIVNSCCWGDMSQSTVNQKGTFAGVISGGTIENCYGISSNTADATTRFYGAKTGGTITGCYSNIAGTANEVDAYGTYAGLRSNLNAWNPGVASTYLEWAANANDSKPPLPNISGQYLTPGTNSKSAKR